MMPKNLDQMELNPKAIEDQERVEFERLQKKFGGNKKRSEKAEDKSKCESLLGGEGTKSMASSKTGKHK